MKVRPASAVEATVGVAALLLFVGYFGIHCFRYPRVGDHLRHVASVASLYRDFLHPAHEAMPVSGKQTEVHTPYIVAIAAAGRALAVTPYRALELSGVANLVFYAWAIWFFFRTFSLLRGSWIPPVVFLLVSLFLRNRVFWWASETSFASLRLIQAYPSLFAWAAALTVFALADRFLRRPRAATLAVVALLVWALVLSHNLTASWVVGIVVLQALFAAFGASGEWRRALALLAVVVAAVALTLAWPYFDVLGSRGLLAVPEGSEFGDHPFRDMAGLYALALFGAVAFLRFRKHRLWVAGFLASFFALQMFRSLGFDYGNRYAFFQAFFAQAIVAESAGFAVAIALGASARLPENLRISPAARAAALVYAAAVLVLTLGAPIARNEANQGRPLLTFEQLLSLPPTHDSYYSQLGGVGRALTESDIVMMPAEHLAWTVASITGARVVASPFAFRVPDFPDRNRAVARFFTSGVPAWERAGILRRYEVTKVLLTQRVRDREAELTVALGPPTVRSGALVLFDVKQ